MIRKQVKELISSGRNYRHLGYTERQLFIRKLLTLPFFILFPLFLAAGFLSRSLRLLVGREGRLQP